MMKQGKQWKHVFSLLAAAVLCCVTGATACAEETVNAILAAKTTQAFTEDAVPEEDLERILTAGLSATSAMNAQPWFFAVVTDKAVMTEISDGMGFGGAAPSGGQPPEGAIPPSEGTAPPPEDGPASGQGPVPAGNGTAKAGLGDSPVAIIVYMDESGMAGSTASFDCGLACQNMFLAANALDYGAKIVSSPTMALNGDDHDVLCEKLGVDPSLKAVAVLLLGKADGGVDGATGATERSALAEKVSFVK